MKILGREPAVYVSVLEAVLALLLSWNLLGLTAESVGAIMAVASALLAFVVAYRTHATLLAVAVGVVKATVALMAAYKFNLSTDQVAAVIALTTVVVGAFQRTQTSPLVQGNFDPV